MISTDFAPNESCSDAWQSIKMIVQPWCWKQGSSLKQLNWQIQRLFANKHITWFLAGRSALYALFKALKLPSGSKILVQGYTCEAVVLPIIALGLKPVYIDIETESYSMNLNDFNHKLSDNCKAVIIQHTYGLTPKYREQIITQAIGKKLVIIEDLAHGWDRNLVQKSKIKSQNYYRLLSFGRSKSLSSVFGSAILTNNKPIADKLNELTKNLPYPKNLFILKCLLYKPISCLIKSMYDCIIGKWLHYMIRKLNLLIPEITPQEKLGNYNIVFNKQYPNALAYLLLKQMNKLDQTNAIRRKIVKYYSNAFKKSQQPNLWYDKALIRYPLVINNRDQVLKISATKNIYLGTWYSQPVAPKGLSLSKVEYKIGSCPIAENVCQKIINLPTNVSLKTAGIVVQLLNDVASIN